MAERGWEKGKAGKYYQGLIDKGHETNSRNI
jgi:hypothetical protein